MVGQADRDPAGMTWVLAVLVALLGAGFSWSYSRYRRQLKREWLYAALMLMIVEVEVRKELTRRGLS